MQPDATPSEAKNNQRQWVFWAILLVLGAIFFLRFSNTQLGTDDIGWLNGEVPTVFDKYRVLSQVSFQILNAVFGPSPEAALATIFAFHVLNAFLLYVFTWQLLASEIAARIAAAVFLINPVTLGTLTWISCLSYVQGITFALAALVAFWHGTTVLRGRWLVIGLICYTLALFASHEIIFLPVIFLLLGWLRGNTALLYGIGAGASGLVIGAVVNVLHYHFGTYGLESPDLLGSNFLAAFASSIVSLGPILAVAYPASFVFNTLDFLLAVFAEMVRWGITLVLMVGGILLYRPKLSWRLWLVLTASFMMLIAPYIFRLYTMSNVVDYHPTYMLTGRVFYAAFVVIAIAWGEFVVQFLGTATRTMRLLSVIALAGYLYATFFLYDWIDFRGLTIVREAMDVPPSWNPYTNDHMLWLIVAALAFIAALAARLMVHRQREGRVIHEI